MGKKAKRLSQIRQNPRQVHFDELDQVMRDAGFEERHSGSHYVYSHAKIQGVVTIVRPHGKGGTQFVAPIYVKQALAGLDKAQALDHE